MKATHLDEFEILLGFKLTKVIGTMTEEEYPEEVIEMTFENDCHVAIEVTFIGGEYIIGKPYAVDSEGFPVKGEFYVSTMNFNGIEKPKFPED